SRAAEYEFGDEKFSDVVHHRRRGEVLESGFVEAERDANAARVARDADAVLVCRGARVLQTTDESADAVLAPTRARGLPLRADLLKVAGPALVDEPNRRRQQLQRQLFVHRQNPFGLRVCIPPGRLRSLARVRRRTVQRGTADALRKSICRAMFPACNARLGGVNAMRTASRKETERGTKNLNLDGRS